MVFDLLGLAIVVVKQSHEEPLAFFVERKFSGEGSLELSEFSGQPLVSRVQLGEVQPCPQASQESD